MVTSAQSKVLVVNIVTYYTSKLTQHAVHSMKIIYTTFSSFLAPVHLLTSSNHHLHQAVITVSITVHYLMYCVIKYVIKMSFIKYISYYISNTTAYHSSIHDY